MGGEAHHRLLVPQASGGEVAHRHTLVGHQRWHAVADAFSRVCYLCSQPIAEGQDWNRDHIPPSRFFGSALKKSLNAQLQWLPTYVKCNSHYRRDEELFVLNASFMASASGSVAADTLLADIRRGLFKGHGDGPFFSLGPNWKPSGEPDGTISFSYDGERTFRVIWKPVRGLYALVMDQPLPIDAPHYCYPLIGPASRSRS